MIPGAVLYLPLEDLVDFEKEKENKIKICNFIKDYEYKINILEVIKKNGKLEIKEVE